MIILKHLLCMLIIYELSWQIMANEVIGCGGYVRSNTEINFKIIKVKLLTKDGIVKYTTESSPVNGYYMIPVYTKGEYILQVNPPPGWSFEPTEVNVNVDGKNDACTKNEDINFFFKGFGLSGKVVTFGDSKANGPSGITLDLLSNSKVIDTTVSGSDGSYYFSNVMPGAYEVEAHHPSIKFQTSKVSVVLSKENWSAKDNIVVSGYKIEGSVVASDKTPIKDALVELFFSDKSYSNINTENFECDLTSKSVENLRVCHTRTDSNGRFSFGNIVFGKYKLASNLFVENMSFNMQPESLQIDLTKHQDVVLNESFKLYQVTISSRAMLSEGKGLKDGELFLNGQNSGIKIGADGSFVLPALSTGNYEFEIKSKNVYFQKKVVNVDLSSSNCLKPDSVQNKQLSSLTNFKAFSFDVCGQVKMIKDQVNANYLSDLTKSVQINFFKVEQNGLKNYKSVNLNEKHQYCVQLEANAEYVAKADLSSNLAQIIKLMPVEQKIHVIDSSIMNIDFEQLEAKLDGTIVLLSKEVPSNLRLTIKLDDPKRSWNRDLLTECSKEVLKNDLGEITNESVKCKFGLTNLLFGNYLLTTNYDDLFCWKKQNSINVNSESQNYLLEQSGYILNYQLSHKNTLLKLVDNDKVLFTKNVLNDNELSGKFCLPDAKNYNLVIESCHKYTSNENDVDTIPIEADLFKSNLNKLTLKALKTQVIIDVLFKFDDPAEKQRVTNDDLFVEVKTSEQATQLVKFKVKSETENQFLFTSKSWFAPNQLIKLNAKSNKILFENNLKELRVDEFNCAANYVQFEAKVGIFLEISVKPTEIDDINLVLKSTADNSVILQETINAAQGLKLGPLKPPFTNYNIELSKSGYLFNKLTSDVKNKDTYETSFNAEKLGQLKVNVINSNLKTNLENVLLSLSSENRLFRQTTKTDLNGLASFDNLKPGLYYLIVMMQEYEFAPNSHPVQISDGFHMNLVIEANRIAYSCFGKVTSINGQAENDVNVQAVGIKSESDNEAENELCKSIQESGQVDNGLGTYRLYNLKPNCEYRLTIKHINEKSDQKVIPENYQFLVNNSDVTGKNFVILNQIEKVDVSLAVSFKSAITPIINPKQLNNYIKVKIFKTSQPNSVLQTQFAPANSIVYFNSLPRDSTQQYSIQVELLSSSSVSLFGSINPSQQIQLQQQPVIESVELSFYSDSVHKHLSVNFDLDKKNYGFGFDFKQQQYQNFYFTLPLFVLVVGLFLNTKRVQQYLQQFFSYVEQKGGFVKFMQSLTNSQNAQPVVSTQKSNKSSHKSNVRDTSLNHSDSEKQKSKVYRSSFDDLGSDTFNSDDSDFQLVGRKKTKKAE